MRAAPLLVVLLASCGSSTKPSVRETPPRSDVSRFSQRPLKIEIEGTSEKRRAFDLTFVGIEVASPNQPDVRNIASVMAKYLRLTITPLAPDVAAHCPLFDAACMTALGVALNAKHLLWGTLAVGDSKLTVSLAILDVAADRVVRDWTEKLALDQIRHETVQGLMERGRLAVLGSDDSTLLVESDVDGSLYVDDILHGKLAVPRTSVRVVPGKHRVKIESRGYASTERELEIPASHFVRVVVTSQTK